MKHEDFKIGLEFWMGFKRWRCTDVVTRTVIAIWINQFDWVEPENQEDWYSGPPYAVAEMVLDECDLPACSLEENSD